MPEWITMQGNEHQRRARSIPDFLSGGHYGYQHQVYLSAAEIFERLAIRKNVGEGLVQYGNIKPENLSFPSQKVKRQAYELAYETLKYQELLEDILSDSGYFFSYPTADDTTALVVVMLFDFQNRKWTPRCQIIGDVISRDVVEVEQNLMGHRIRLAAALARCRVKNQSLSIDYVLPESVRQQEKCASALPQYAWVNTVKTSMNAVIEELIRNNYIEYLESSDMVVPPRGKFFHRDQHCEDVILFPSDQKEALKCLDIVEDNDLILQDKTSSLAAQAVAALLTEDDECDLIHSDVSSGYTTAHLAVLLHKVSKKRFEARELMYGNSVNHFGSAPSNQEQQELHRPTVYACGVRNDAHRDKLNTLIKSMGLKNVKFLSDKFENIDGAKDPRFERVKAILVTPQCTRTAVANPVEFMLNEGDTESYAVLRDLSHGERHNRAAESGRAHVETIKTALKFPNIAACVYVTRSIHSVENEQAIQTAIKWHRDTSDGLQPFRICPPTLPLSSNDIKEGDYITPVAGNSRSRSSLLKQKYLKMRQSSEMNGCFIAVLSREIDPMDSMTVKDILRRAALKGLIAPTSPTTKPKQPKEEKAVVETPPVETPTVKTEQQPVEKIKRHKSKVAFGKKVKPSSVTNVTRLKKTNSKSVDSNDVDKMLDQYKSTSKTKSSNEVGGKTSDMAQVSINLEFHNTSSLRFSETPPASPKHDSTKISGPCMQSQINSDVETILTRLSSREASRM